MKALTTTGLTELITKIKAALGGKVDKVSGKGLSTNDYDNTEKGNVALNTVARHSHSNKGELDQIEDFVDVEPLETTDVEQLTIEDSEEIDIESADTISIDATPTASSTNLVTSGGVKAYVDGHHDSTKQDVLAFASSTDIETYCINILN